MKKKTLILHAKIFIGIRYTTLLVIFMSSKMLYTNNNLLTFTRNYNYNSYLYSILQCLVSHNNNVYTVQSKI